MTIVELIAKETKRHKASLWGQAYWIEPVIHPKIFGDGLQLCYLGTIDQRPNYWLIRIDSSINVEAGNFNYEEHLLNPLEEAFGTHPNLVINAQEFKALKKLNNNHLENYNTFAEYKSACKYPAVWWSGGHFGSIANFKTKPAEI